MKHSRKDLHGLRQMAEDKSDVLKCPEDVLRDHNAELNKRVGESVSRLQENQERMR